jgi:hypothetical protein
MSNGMLEGCRTLQQVGYGIIFFKNKSQGESIADVSLYVLTAV